MGKESSDPRVAPGFGHDWAPGHRLGPPRRGPIVSPRALDVAEMRPAGATVVPPLAGAGASTRLSELRDELVREGWTVTEAVSATAEPELLAERDLRLDLTALRTVHLFQLACAVEFAGAILLGFLWPALGHPLWEGEGITATAIVGAVGLVAILARVDFVSLVLVVQRLPGRPASADGARPAGPSRLVWARRIWSRNWEVLGDRGGRTVVDSRGTAESDEATSNARSRLSDPSPAATRRADSTPGSARESAPDA